MPERARTMLDQMQLEAFRQSLPQRERYEVHRFFVVKWDIVAARYFIQQTNKRLDSMPVAGAARAYNFDKPYVNTIETSSSFALIDPTRAMSEEIDTNVPVILALIAREKEGKRPIPLLIDGLHRLYKAYREEKETIPCYALTPNEEQLCRL